MNREQAMKRVELEMQMDDDLRVVLDHIESAYSSDDDDGGYFHSTLEKEDRERLFQALLSLSKRLKVLEANLALS